MSSEPIVLYDIPAREASRMAWSPNTWKSRYVLNYKGLKYKTEWVEYPDIEARCKEIGAPPTERKADGRDHYTLPVIYDPNTKVVVADSDTIAKYLEETYPDTPRLFPDGTRAFQTAFYQLLRPTIMSPTMNILISRISAQLNPRSQEYFRRTREEAFGKKLEDVTSEDDWQRLESGLERIKTCLDANGEGKDLLLMGNRITWADIQLAAVFVWIRVTVGEGSEDWRRIADLHSGRWAKFMDQFAKYESVDL